MSEPTREQTIEALEFQKDKTVEQIAFAERVERLLNNLDFKAVILDTYCNKEAANLVHQSGDPTLTVAQRADSLAMAQATGHMKRWLQVQMTIKNQLKDTLPEIDDTLEQLRAMSDEDFAQE